MYSNINKCFIQYMLSKGSVDLHKAKEFITEFTEHTKEEPKSLATIIKEINEKIVDHKFRIVIKKNELTGTTKCCLINTVNDNISCMPREFNTADYEYFAFIMKEIMLSGGKHISMITCLNLAPKAKQGKEVAQKKIDRFCELDYLFKENGQIYFGPRGIAEFEEYLKQQYRNRMTVCNLCNDNVYYGEICAKCNEVIHKYCIEEYNYKGQKCPICKASWESALTREYSSDESDNDDENEDDVSISSQVTLIRTPIR